MKPLNPGPVWNGGIQKQKNREKHRNRKGTEIENTGLKKHRNL
jgi:hypothetical protein